MIILNYNKYMNNKIKIGLTVGIVLIIVAIVIGGVFWMSNKNQSNEPAQDKTSILLLNSANKTIDAVNSNNLQRTSFYKIPETDNVDFALYSNVIKKLAYMTTDSKTDHLKITDTKSGTIQEIENAYHGDDVDLSAGSLGDISEFSPNAFYITYTMWGWESCRDVIRNVDNKQELPLSIPGATGCGSTRWSPSGKRIVVFSSAGMGTSDELGISEKGNIANIQDVNFQSLKGDINKIQYENNNGDSYLSESIFSADFIDDDHVVFISQSDGTSDLGANNNPKLFLYNDATKTLKYITEIELGSMDVRAVRNTNSVLVNTGSYDNNSGNYGNGKIILVDLATGEQQIIFQEQPSTISNYFDVSLVDVFGENVVVNATDRDSKNNFISTKIILLNLSDGAQKVISQDENDSYAGFRIN